MFVESTFHGCFPLFATLPYHYHYAREFPFSAATAFLFPITTPVTPRNTPFVTLRHSTFHSVAIHYPSLHSYRAHSPLQVAPVFTLLDLCVISREITPLHLQECAFVFDRLRL